MTKSHKKRYSTHRQLKKIQTPQELEQSYAIMKELRTDLTFQDYVALTEAAKIHDDYTLVALYEQDQPIAVMGYRILFDLVHGKHLYIDDLVVTVTHRSQGLGAKLLEHAEDEARKLNCQGLRLCTGINRKDAQRFYDCNGWNARALAYKKKL